MIVLGIEPLDIHVTLQYSAKEISMLLDFLDHCKMEYNSKEEPEMKKVEEYMNEEFFPNHQKLLMDIEGGK